METVAQLGKRLFPFITPRNADQMITIGITMALIGLGTLVAIEIIKRRRT